MGGILTVETVMGHSSFLFCCSLNGWLHEEQENLEITVVNRKVVHTHEEKCLLILKV